MTNIYLVEGYDSWNKRVWAQTFNTLKEAENASKGLTEPKITRWQGNNKTTAFNKICFHLLTVK